MPLHVYCDVQPQRSDHGSQTLSPELASLPMPLPCLTPTPLAIHVGVSLPSQHTMLVGGSAESLRDIQEGVATIQDPCHFLGACPKLVIHQLRQ